MINSILHNKPYLIQNIFENRNLSQFSDDPICLLFSLYRFFILVIIEEKIISLFSWTL